MDGSFNFFNCEFVISRAKRREHLLFMGIEKTHCFGRSLEPDVILTRGRAVPSDYNLRFIKTRSPKMWRVERDSRFFSSFLRNVGDRADHIIEQIADILGQKGIGACHGSFCCRTFCTC